MKEQPLGEVLDGYLKALEAGRPPDRDALLAAHPDLADELDAALLGIDFVRGAGPCLAPEDRDVLAGGSLGDYRLVRELGRGGMAVVYEAEQISLGRRVALKVLPFAAVLDPKQLQRFKNEAMAAAHLHHANIVPVYGVGCERGVHYYAMQFVEGQSLATAILDLKRGGTGEGSRTPISSHGSNREPAYIRMAAALGVQAAEALDHAHQLGIVHRDVKPGNLLVDLAGSLWVTDFGLASSMKDVGLTITGELLGTIRYMSPEQALAKRVPIDHRTDVYSLGATLYELFTLEPAFPGDDAHRVIQDIAFKEATLPRRLNPALPRDLETVILKAMWKDPVGRYATAQEMADDLRRFLENRPIEAKRPGLLRRASKWGRRHRTLVGATVALLVLSTAGLAIGGALLWREQAQTKAALDSAQANVFLALQALDQIYIDEAEGYPKILQGLPRNLLQKGLGFYEAFAKENARNKSVVSWMGIACQRAGLIFRALGEEERAVESLDRAVSAFERALEIDPRDTLALHNRGIALSDLGRFEEALAAYDRTLEIDPRDAVAHNSRGTVLCDHLGRPGDALAAFDRAIEFDRRDAGAHTNRGKTLRDLGRLEDALAACARALEIDPRYTAAHNMRAAALRDLGRSEDALAAWDRALEIDPQYVFAHHNRGVVLRGLRRFDQALAAFDRALEIDSRNALFHNSRAGVLDDLGRSEDALAAYDRVIAIDPRHTGAHNNRGLALRDLGRFEEALAAHERALEIDPGDAPAHNNRGNVLVELRRFEDALAAYDRAIEIDSQNARIDNNRGVVLCDHLGRPGDALAAFDRSIELDQRDAGVHTNRGVALRNLGRSEESLAACDRALALDPRNPVLHDRRGDALRALGRFEEALAAHGRALKIDPRNAAAHTSRGIALNNLRRFEEALAAIDRALEIDPQHAPAHLNRGNALYMLGRVGEALEAYDRALQIDPRNASAHNSRGAALGAKGEIEAAIGAYREAIRLQPDFYAHSNLANALAATGDLDAAILEYREAIRLDPDRAEAHCNLGRALMRRGRFQDAVPCLRRGHELGSMRAKWNFPSGKWIEDAERKAVVEGRLDQVLSRKAQPRDAAERIEFALVLQDKALHAESARMYAEAFSEDAALAENLAAGHRYNAACQASLEAARGGADAPEWRGRALQWLRSHLAALGKAPSDLAATLEHWNEDPDLVSVRDRLGDLPELERAAWRDLWAAVDLGLAAARPAAK